MLDYTDLNPKSWIRLGGSLYATYVVYQNTENNRKVILEPVYDIDAYVYEAARDSVVLDYIPADSGFRTGIITLSKDEEIFKKQLDQLQNKEFDHAFWCEQPITIDTPIEDFITKLIETD